MAAACWHTYGSGEDVRIGAPPRVAIVRDSAATGVCASTSELLTEKMPYVGGPRVSMDSIKGRFKDQQRERHCGKRGPMTPNTTWRTCVRTGVCPSDEAPGAGGVPRKRGRPGMVWMASSGSLGSSLSMSRPGTSPTPIPIWELEESWSTMSRPGSSQSEMPAWSHWEGAKQQSLSPHASVQSLGNSSSVSISGTSWATSSAPRLSTSCGGGGSRNKEVLCFMLNGKSLQKDTLPEAMVVKERRPSRVPQMDDSRVSVTTPEGKRHSVSVGASRLSLSATPSRPGSQCGSRRHSRVMSRRPSQRLPPVLLPPAWMLARPAPNHSSLEGGASLHEQDQASPTGTVLSIPIGSFPGATPPDTFRPASPPQERLEDPEQPQQGNTSGTPEAASQSTRKRGSYLGEENREQRQSVLFRSASSMGVVGGRRPEEALYDANEGFSPAELKRVQHVFRLHCNKDSWDVSRQDIPDILQHLGYLPCHDSPSILEQIIEEVSTFPLLELEDVTRVVERYAAYERDRLQTEFGARADEVSGRLRKEELAGLLHALGGAKPLSSTVDEVLEATLLHHKQTLTYEDFMAFIAVYRVTEGFSREEVGEAQRVFIEVAAPAASAEAATGTDSPKRSSNASSFTADTLRGTIKASDVPRALQRMLGLHVNKLIVYFMEKLDLGDERRDSVKSEADSNGGGAGAGIAFHDFLIFYRQVNEQAMEELRQLFVQAAGSNEGTLAANKLKGAVTHLGFTLLQDEVEEIMETAGLEVDADQKFEGFVAFVRACRQCSGFRRSELEDMTAAFRRFDYDGSGDIKAMELLDLLRYLGYTSTLKDMHRFLEEADADSSGTMDLPEFLMVMRIFREEQMRSLQKSFRANCSSLYPDAPSELDVVQAYQVGEMLEANGIKLSDAMVNHALAHIGCPQELDFEGFVRISDACRRKAADDRRKRAGFSDHDYAGIKYLFEKHCREDRLVLERGELLWLLIEVGVPVGTNEERQHVFGMVENARWAARRNGITAEEVGADGTSAVTFWTLVYLLRNISRTEESRIVTREEEAIDQTGFSQAEVQDFRMIFNKWIKARRKVEVEAAEERQALVETKPTKRRTAFSCNSWNTPGMPQKANTGILGHTRFYRPSVPQVSALNARQSVMQKDAGRQAPLRRILEGTGSTVEEEEDEEEQSEEGPVGPSLELSGLGATEDERLPFEDLQSMLVSIGLRLEGNESWRLKLQAQQISGREDAAVDFVNFLLLMHWMVDTNFANINSTTEKMAASAPAPAAGGSAKKGTVVGLRRRSC